MNKFTVISVSRVLIRFLLGGLLIFAGVLKAQDNTTLLETVAYITWIPTGVKSLLIDSLPWVEILTGTLLISHIFDKVVLPATGVIYLCFFLFAVWGLSTGVEADCGCFGDLDGSSLIGSILGSEMGWPMVIRNGIFVALAGFLLWKPGSRNT